jgi:hypothetical protein
MISVTLEFHESLRTLTLFPKVRVHDRAS